MIEHLRGRERALGREHEPLRETLTVTTEAFSRVKIANETYSFTFCGTGGRVCPIFSSYRFITRSVSFLTPAMITS